MSFAEFLCTKTQNEAGAIEDSTNTKGGVKRKIRSLGGAKSQIIRATKRGKYKVQLNETNLQTWLSSQERVEMKEDSKSVDSTEISDPEKGNEKKGFDLMPREMTLPPLEKETYIPPNQLENDQDFGDEQGPVTDKDIEELWNSDSKDMTINSLRQSLELKDKEIKELKNAMQKIAKLVPYEFYPAFQEIFYDLRNVQITLKFKTGQLPSCRKKAVIFNSIDKRKKKSISIKP